jgi:hypothetical protein
MPSGATLNYNNPLSGTIMEKVKLINLGEVTAEEVKEIISKLLDEDESIGTVEFRSDEELPEALKQALEDRGFKHEGRKERPPKPDANARWCDECDEWHPGNAKLNRVRDAVGSEAKQAAAIKSLTETLETHKAAIPIIEKLIASIAIPIKDRIPLVTMLEEVHLALQLRELHDKL